VSKAATELMPQEFQVNRAYALVAGSNKIIPAEMGRSSNERQSGICRDFHTAHFPMPDRYLPAKGARILQTVNPNPAPRLSKLIELVPI